jgi:uncharacterized paraquat-inducible protein A
MHLFGEVPLLRRSLFRVAILPCAAIFTITAVDYARSSTLPHALASAAVAVIAATWCWLWYRRFRRRAREILIRTRGMCCTHCGYVLVTLPDGNCPECGHSYYADHATRLWQHAAGFPD